MKLKTAHVLTASAALVIFAFLWVVCSRHIPVVKAEAIPVLGTGSTLVAVVYFALRRIFRG